MGDQRARYFRRVRRLRRSARRWSVLAATLGGASVVLVPYAGIGLPDAVWAAGAGGAAALTAWRWRDLRALVAVPPPPEADPAMAAARARRRIEAMVAGLPGGPGAVAELRRQRDLFRLRGSPVRPAWVRLDRAALTLHSLAGRLSGPAEAALLEAAVAERTLRELGERTAGVGKALRIADGQARVTLARAHDELLAEFETGVGAYEQLVAAAAGYVAEAGRVTGDPRAVGRLTEATDMLRAFAEGFSELRAATTPPTTAV